MGEYANAELQEALDALSDAKKMRRAGVTNEATITRLYYACFHAANAALYANGLDPGSHQGTVRLFGREVVMKGDVPREDGRFLTDMRSLRQTADYTHDPHDVNLDELLERTRSFVARMEELVSGSE